MASSFYFSSGAYLERSLAARLDQCESEGLGGFEFSSGLPYSPGLVEEVRAAGTRNLDLLIHNYFPPPQKSFVLNLAANDQGILEESVGLARLAIELSAELKAPFYSVHSGFAMNLRADQLGQPEAQASLAKKELIDPRAAEQVFAQEVSRLAQYAAGLGVGLLIENNVLTRVQVEAGRADSLLMSSPEQLRRFLDEQPGVGLLFDVAHGKIAANALGFAPEEFFDKLQDKICALHLSDNDGERDNNRSFEKDAWFAPYLKELAHLPMVIEVYRLNAEERARQAEVLGTLLSR